MVRHDRGALGETRMTGLINDFLAGNVIEDAAATVNVQEKLL